MSPFGEQGLEGGMAAVQEQMLEQAGRLVAEQQERTRLQDMSISLTPRTTHVYIDGESHFIRSEQCVKEMLQRDITLADYVELMRQDRERFKQQNGIEVVYHRVVVPQCKFFWDGDADPSLKEAVKVYFTSCTGDEDALHGYRLRLRSEGFEPQIVKERASLAKQRGNSLTNEAVIEKAKAVDIALAVRMLEDAQRSVYTHCALFTSDLDFLPVIEAVQRMGKSVWVYGYRSGIGKNSPLEYTPARFVDLGVEMKRVSQFLS